MNFLAHFHLAWPEPELLLGALEGDFHKGPVSRDLPPGLAAGIRLHRRIDALTDQDPAVAALRRHFPEDLRRFAGIAVDLMFDHYLARHWEHYAEQPLSQFSAEIYRLLHRRGGELSSAAQVMAQRLSAHDLLCRYASWQPIDRALAAAGRRLRRGGPLSNAGQRLEPLRPAAAAAFRDFYPRLQAQVAPYKRRPA